MKIALIIKHYSIYRGGAERHAVHLSRAMAQEGHEVHVLANQFESPETPFLKWHPIPIRKKPAWWKVISFALNVRKVLQKESFDIVYGLTQIYPQDLHRMGDGIYRHWMKIRFPFAPLRWVHYGIRPVHLANLYLESCIYRPENYQAIIANSELCKRHVRDYYGVPENRVEVIYNGVDHEMFHPERIAPFRKEMREKLSIPPNAPVILFISNNWKRKGLSVILRAMALAGVKNSPYHLIIAGRGNPRSYLRLSRKLGLEDRVRFVGPTREVEKYYSAGDLFILPTLYDPFANVCLEAMACGLPVITTASNGVSELIREGSNGYIMKDAKNTEELSHLLKLCSDRETLQKMGRTAWEISLQYTWQKNVLQTLNVCQRIVEEKNVRREA